MAVPLVSHMNEFTGTRCFPLAAVELCIVISAGGRRAPYSLRSDLVPDVELHGPEDGEDSCTTRTAVRYIPRRPSLLSFLLFPPSYSQAQQCVAAAFLLASTSC